MEFIPKLLESGVLGVILAISISLNYYLIKLLLDSYKTRIEEAKQYNVKLAGVILKFSNTIERLEKKVTLSKRKSQGGGDE